MEFGELSSNAIPPTLRYHRAIESDKLETTDGESPMGNKRIVVSAPQMWPDLVIKKVSLVRKERRKENRGNELRENIFSGFRLNELVALGRLLIKTEPPPLSRSDGKAPSSETVSLGVRIRTSREFGGETTGPPAEADS